MAAVVAAVAALITVRFARATVQEARAARKEAASAHAEQMTEDRDARAAEVRVQRIVRLDRLADLILEMADVAREESLRRTTPRMPSGLPVSRLPVLQRRLAATVSAVEELGGPTVGAAAELANADPQMPDLILGQATSALDEIRSVLNSSSQLDPPS